MAYTKLYTRRNWKNFPDESTPINETNLNAMDVAINELDNRSVELDGVKATKLEIATMVTAVDFDEQTGIFTFTRQNGTKFTIDTLMEKLAINFDFKQDTQKLIITLEDGTTKEVDLSSLISQNEFLDSDTINFEVTDGKVKADIINGSITDSKLRPDYLADIRIESSKATLSANNAKVSEENAKLSETNAKTSEENAKDSEVNAKTSENNSKLSEINAKSSEDTSKAYAVGDSNSSKFYYEQVKNISQSLTGGGIIPMETVKFANLPSLDDINIGFMYNIKDEFVTTSDFVEGAGHTIPSGSNIYKNNDNKWDVLAGSSVSGVKGDAETSYRQGNVNLTPQDLGIFDAIYPIGSIYMSVNNVNPSTLFGGTWVAWGNGRVPVGVSSSDSNFNTVEKTGGASTVTLTQNQMPSHTHKFTGTAGTTGGDNQGHTHSFTTSTNGAHVHNYRNDVLQQLYINAGPSPFGSIIAGTNDGIQTATSGAHSHSGTTGTINSKHSHNYTPLGSNSVSGSGEAHSNLQPYITCYMWKRTA